VIVVGVLLLVASVLATVGVGLFNSEASNASAFGVTLSNVSIGGLFMTGVVVGFLGAAGLGLILVGAARKRSKKTIVKRNVRDAQGEAKALAEENARLQEQLHKGATTGPDAVQYPSGSTDSGRSLG